MDVSFTNQSYFSPGVAPAAHKRSHRTSRYELWMSAALASSLERKKLHPVAASSGFYFDANLEGDRIPGSLHLCSSRDSEKDS